MAIERVKTSCAKMFMMRMNETLKTQLEKESERTQKSQSLIITEALQEFFQKKRSIPEK